MPHCRQRGSGAVGPCGTPQGWEEITSWMMESCFFWAGSCLHSRDDDGGGVQKRREQQAAPVEALRQGQWVMRGGGENECHNGSRSRSRSNLVEEGSGGLVPVWREFRSTAQGGSAVTLGKERY